MRPASSPVIHIPNVDAFKQKVEKVSKQFQAELEDLQNRIKTLSPLPPIPKSLFGQI